MFSLIKIALWFIFFFAWLFGKLNGNEIRTTFRDWFPFLFFIYLLVTVVLADNIWKFHFWQCLILIFFILEIYGDVIRGMRYFFSRIKIGNTIIKKYKKLKEYLLVKKLEDFSGFIVGFIFIAAIWLQLSEDIDYKLPVVDLRSKSNIEIVGFIVAILSMYGIYVGFLQYLTNDERSNFYLGRNKLNYLLEKSFWYYTTQSKTFAFLLFSTILIPFLIKSDSNGYYRELSILWQTSYFFLLVIYIFLLKMSLYIIRVALLIKAKYDENLLRNMQKEIQKSYSETFDLVWTNRGQYANEFIGNKLSRDFKRLTVDEYQEFVNTVFNIENFNTNNWYYSLQYRIENGFQLTPTRKLINWFTVKFDSYGDESNLEKYKIKNEGDLSKEWGDFYSFFKTFVKGKWEFLKQYENNFSAESWKNLILGDLKIIDKIVKNDPTSESLKKEYPDERGDRSVPLYRSENIREFLFNLLVEKEEINLDDILGDVTEEIRNFKQNKADQFYRYSYDFLRFRLVTLLDKYKNGNIDLSLPKFKKLSDYHMFQDGQRTDYENSMIYSRICFNYLDEGRIEDFSQSKIEKSDDEEEKSRSKKIQNLILSMNEEYRLAFMLYQLLYTDRIQWDDNLKFYEIEIKKIMSYDEQYHDYLFNQSKKIMLTADISHSITERLLDKLWETRNDTIKDFSWFDQFGGRHLMSDFKILYIQWLLGEKNYSYSDSRFDIERNFPIKMRKSLVGKIKGKENRKMSVQNLKLKWRIRCKEERIGHFCRDYLLLTDQLTTIFTKESYSYKQNNLQLSVEYLLHSGKVNLSDVIDNISVTSLLRLEWILRWNYHHYHRESDYTSRTFFDEMIFRYYGSGGEGILEFYIVKIIDNFYYDLFQDRKFMAGFKYHLESQLNSLNKTVDECVELIAERVSGIDNISILQKGQIISKLNDILFGQKEKFEQNMQSETFCHRDIHRWDISKRRRGGRIKNIRKHS